MLVNADFSRRAIVTPEQYQWVASPQEAVERVMLDRIGGEQARATSIVRYAPGSGFPRHAHPGGEEILVLSGTFSDDGGHYPAGCYLRNPPGSSHEPASQEGALLFVKLRQMPPAETRPVRVDTRDPSRWQREPRREVCPLFASGREQVCLQRLAPAESLFTAPLQGAEVLVLAGHVMVGAQPCERGSWVRLPAGDYPEIGAGGQGATVYLKVGRLGLPAGEA